MRHGSLKRFGGAVAAATALAWSSTALAFEQPRFKISERYVVSVDSVVVQEAKVFEGENRRSSYLVDIPSEDTLFLFDKSVMAAYAVRRENVKYSEGGTTARFEERFEFNVRVHSVGYGFKFGFNTGKADVLVVRQDGPPPDPGSVEGSPAVGSPTAAIPGVTPVAPDPDGAPAPAEAGVQSSEAGNGAPLPGSPALAKAAPPSQQSGPANPGSNAPAARACVSLESRPAAGIPGCAQSVYIRNSCGAPVLAVVQRTEHLMTGTLPQSFDVTVPPGEQWLGCSWWSGAMAPANNENAGAAYPEPATPPHGRHNQRPNH